MTATTPHKRALIAGGEDALLHHLLPHIQQAHSVDVAVAFILDSGVRLLHPYLQELLDRGGRLRLIAGDYLDVTDPSSLRRLLDLDGDVHRWIFEANLLSFHPKSWIFHFAQGSGIAIVGSSNLSETALRSVIEWNYRLYDATKANGWQDVLDGFEELLKKNEVKELTNDWIDGYEARRVRLDMPRRELAEAPPEPPLPAPIPHGIQLQALDALRNSRRQGYTAGLVVLATGLGKTWLSAFDSESFDRILFVAHREEILSQAMATFRRLRPTARFGRYAGDEKDLQADVLFASIQTLGRVSHLRNFPADAFDYIVVDEFHHAAARTYRTLIGHFTPKFLLGLTATPERTDGGERPTATEVFHAGFNPRATGHGGWFSFAEHMGDLSAAEKSVHQRHGAFLDSVASTPMSRSYKMLLLEAMLQRNSLSGSMHVDALTAEVARVAARNPRFKQDISVPLDDTDKVKRLLIENPIAAWIGGKGTGGETYFAFDADSFHTTFEVAPAVRSAFVDMVRETIDWRLAQYLDRTIEEPSEEPEGGKPGGEGNAFELWHSYARNEIPPFFKATFNTGSWNSGMVTVGQNLILLVTLTKGNLAAGNEYVDHFIDAQTFEWQSQNQTVQSSRHGQIINGSLPGHDVHLFVRPNKLRGAKAAPFTYCGVVAFQKWDGEKPITVTWRLSSPVPEHLRRLFKIEP